jgi:hypothetical protein
MGDLHEKYAILLRIYDHPPVQAGNSLQPLGQRFFALCERPLSTKQ